MQTCLDGVGHIERVDARRQRGVEDVLGPERKCRPSDEKIEDVLNRASFHGS